MLPGKVWRSLCNNRRWHADPIDHTCPCPNHDGPYHNMRVAATQPCIVLVAVSYSNCDIFVFIDRRHHSTYFANDNYSFDN